MIGVIHNAIMHGSFNLRVDAAVCFKYIIEFSEIKVIKTEVIKIVGALIRVVSDKFASELKVEIFAALKLILLKGGLTIKPIYSQLQTTFLKSFSDQLGTPHLRRIVSENLLLLVAVIPKLDPIVKDIVTQLASEKLDDF